MKPTNFEEEVHIYRARADAFANRARGVMYLAIAFAAAVFGGLMLFGQN